MNETKSAQSSEISKIIKMTKIPKIYDEFPLSPRWSKPEVYIEPSSLLSEGECAIGLMTQSQSGKQAFSSAVGPVATAPIRAYFELIERTSILEAIEAEKDQYAVIGEDCALQGWVDSSAVFPQGNSEAPWEYSKSNGVAAHPDIRIARSSALMEVLERDAVLRSWHFDQPAVLASMELISVPQLLLDQFEFQVIQFQQSCEVVGIFGLPQSSRLPTCFGFGSGRSTSDAVQPAWNEVLQRLVFTWGEEVSIDLPQCQPTPDFHLEYYLRPETQKYVKGWLKRILVAQPQNGISVSASSGSVQFVDITPPHLEGRLWVVKAISKHHLPLIFGNYQYVLNGKPSEAHLPHPIA